MKEFREDSTKEYWKEFMKVARKKSLKGFRQNTLKKKSPTNHSRDLRKNPARACAGIFEEFLEKNNTGIPAEISGGILNEIPEETREDFQEKFPKE